MPDDSALFVFTIYREARGYTARPYRIERGGPVELRLQTPYVPALDQARAMLPPEADAMIARSDADHPAIVESWLAVMAADALDASHYPG